MKPKQTSLTRSCSLEAPAYYGVAGIGATASVAAKMTRSKGVYLGRLPLLNKTVDSGIRISAGTALRWRCTADFCFYCPQVKHHHEEVQ
ncbi:MAG: hypothetical protein QNJ72_33710 [Pleurocapsa sp. MO_226.B13]|nr:hypothetical protein [Pleurocapsa sp. MO_226.B13]